MTEQIVAGNSFGKIFKVTTFGESHGALIGAVIDGCPAGLKIDQAFIQQQLDRRKPGQSHLTTARTEADQVKIVSGVFENVTTGTPIAGLIENADSRSQDYKHLEESFRPSHADFTYQVKYGHRDHRGGGRSSARETAARVFAGAIAQLLLREHKVQIHAYVSRVGSFSVDKDYSKLDLNKTYDSIVRCPDAQAEAEMVRLIENAKKDGDTLGGVITGVIKNCPPGLGEPVFDRLHADLGKAMLSINAVKGFEIGSGFKGTEMRGSDHNDEFINQGGQIKTSTNHSGGIQGGISNGMDIYFRVAFKPVATIMQTQSTVNTKGDAVDLQGRGRHDPCVLPRAVSIVEAMAALTLTDHLLRNKLSKI
jgi:chorismate synthase